MPILVGNQNATICFELKQILAKMDGNSAIHENLSCYVPTRKRNKRTYT